MTLIKKKKEYMNIRSGTIKGEHGQNVIEGLGPEIWAGGQVKKREETAYTTRLCDKSDGTRACH